MPGSRIVAMEWGIVESQRPRPALCNARLGAHGAVMRDPLLRIRTDDGLSGFGWSRVDREDAEAFLGREITALITVESGTVPEARSIDFPLWDLLGQQQNQPVYALAAQYAEKPVPAEFRAPCYDTSLYIDDLHLDSHEAAAELIAAEALEGLARGHSAFKIKVGRGALHMPLEAGTKRDIAVIRAVREAVGPDSTIMIDANNGYNLNLAKHVLAETADVRLHWLEEAFHEDAVLYRHLQDWLHEEGLHTLIADGEGKADPRLLDWVQEGLINVVQYDIRDIGFTRWLELGQQLDSWDRISAPHNYGGNFSNYASAHVKAAIDNFAYVEWDHGETDVWDSSGYRIDSGAVHVPDAPGWGLMLDEALWRTCVDTTGFRLSL